MKAMCLTAALLMGLPLTVSAQDLTNAEAGSLPRIIDAACFDLVEASNGCEQVMVLRSETWDNSSDLIILGDWRTDPPSAPLLIARGMAFNGSMWGMSPSVERADNGSLLLHSEQSGIGRYPWFQTLTIAWREGGFIVAGFSYSSYDRGGGGSMTCDVNLLTGAYTVEATVVNAETEVETTVLSDAGSLEAVRITAADWPQNGVFPPPCDAGLEALFSEG